jgi:hypothetical protein
MPEMEHKTMTCDAPQLIPLTRAYLCQDCDSIGTYSTHCPACASRVVMGLASVLDRKVESEIESLRVFPVGSLKIDYSVHQG